MSEEKLNLEATLKVYNYIREHPRENRNYVLRATKEMGISNIQFNKAEDVLYDMCLINEVKIPTGVGYIVDSEIMNPEGILKKHFKIIEEIREKPCAQTKS